MGDMLGGIMVAVFLGLGIGVGTQTWPLLIAAAVLGLAGVGVALMLHSGYVATLVSGLRAGAVQLDLSEVADQTTRTTTLKTLHELGHSHAIDMRSLLKGAGAAPTPVPGSTPRSAETASGSGPPASPQASGWAGWSTSAGAPRPPASSAPPTIAPTTAGSGVAQRLADLASGDTVRIRTALRATATPGPEIVPHVIALLERDDISQDASAALRAVAARHVGQIADALLDPERPFAVRRRIPRVLAGVHSPRAVQALFAGLEDKRFDVRVQCGRALARIHAESLDTTFDRSQVFAAVLREVDVERHVWEGQREMRELEDTADTPFVDQFLRRRADAGLEHVFTLLSLALPSQPLKIAFQGLHTNDEILRGMALEYLESVLPADVRHKLWPFLEERERADRPQRPREQILDDLLRSNDSIRINLAELRKLQDRG
jgi:hypothetical protein